MFFWGLARASLWGVPYLSLNLPKVDYKMKIDKDPYPFFLYFLYIFLFEIGKISPVSDVCLRPGPGQLVGGSLL